MNTQLSPWYALADEGSTVFRCAACHVESDLGGPQLDHHPRVCPKCGVDCAFLNWKGRLLQVVPGNAPQVFQRLLRFAQNEYDELEYVELLVAMEELMDSLYAASLP